MSGKSKKFLVPVAASIAALAAGNAQASPQPNSTHETASSKASPKSVDLAAQQDAQRIKFTMGDEMHSLILARNNQGIILADHESHSSHASHASHASHTSGS